MDVMRKPGHIERGDFVPITVQGDFGKPRPALVIQADLFNEVYSSVTVLLVTGDIVDAPLFRITVEPDELNGLQKTSQIMVDKVMTVKRERVREPFGSASDDVMLAVNRSLIVFLGIA
jgi:mRNA interferase MazF